MRPYFRPFRGRDCGRSVPHAVSGMPRRLCFLVLGLPEQDGYPFEPSRHHLGVSASRVSPFVDLQHSQPNSWDRSPLYRSSPAAFPDGGYYINPMTKGPPVTKAATPPTPSCEGAGGGTSWRKAQNLGTRRASTGTCGISHDFGQHLYAQNASYHSPVLGTLFVLRP